VLVIMGLVGTLFYGLIIDYIGKEKNDQAVQLLDLAREELVGAAVKDNALPDPVTGTDLMPVSLVNKKDPWGGDVRYWPAVEFAGGASLTAEPGTSLVVKVFGDAASFPGGTPERTVNDVAYVLASSGPNMSRQVWLSETPPTRQTEIRILKPLGTLSSGEEFDDIVRFVTLNELKAKVTAVR